jgi:hypothetical protein
VGFYDPSGKWIPESDHGNREDAADRVHWLNGGEKEEEISPYMAAIMVERAKGFTKGL